MKLRDKLGSNFKMRPIIDKNNPGNSEETLIYISKINIVWKICMLIATVIVFICNSECKEVILILLAFGIFLFQIYFLVKSIKRINEIQFRINSKGIQYKDLPLTPWNNIKNERAPTEHTSDDNSNKYFIYHIVDSDKVMRFNLRKFNISKGELQLALNRQRNSFNTENNIL